MSPAREVAGEIELANADVGPPEPHRGAAEREVRLVGKGRHVVGQRDRLGRDSWTPSCRPGRTSTPTVRRGWRARGLADRATRTAATLRSKVLCSSRSAYPRIAFIGADMASRTSSSRWSRCRDSAAFEHDVEATPEEPERLVVGEDAGRPRPLPEVERDRLSGSAAALVLLGEAAATCSRSSAFSTCERGREPPVLEPPLRRVDRRVRLVHAAGRGRSRSRARPVAGRVAATARRLHALR